MYVKPASDKIKVRDHYTKKLVPPEGMQVPRDTFWLRRLIAGDVIETAEPIIDTSADVKEEN